ncbi:MAG: 4a-hydroxytetrahydrobiopterin dehydratase [Bacteroidota bacterium]
MEKLSTEEIQNQLKEVNHWVFEQDKITRKIEFKDFKDAFATMTRIAFEAEKQVHHPEWKNTYNELEISLRSHDADGLTQKDFDLAQAIDKIID